MNDQPDMPAVRVFAMDGHGGAQAASLDTIEAVPPGSNSFGFVWIHLLGSDADALDWLETDSGIDSFIHEALTAEDTRPRCTAHGDGAIINLRGVNLHEGAEPEDMISLRLWVEARRVVGVWRRPLYAVNDLFSSIERGVAPVSPGDLVAKLALRLADRMSRSMTWKTCSTRRAVPLRTAATWPRSADRRSCCAAISRRSAMRSIRWRSRI